MKHLLLTALLACAIGSVAQTTPAASPANSQTAAAQDHASLEQVNQLLTALKSRQQMETTLEGIKEQIKKGQMQGFELALQKKGVILTGADRERAKTRLDAIVEEMFKQMPYDEMMASVAKIYSEHFTSEDVAAFLAFYRSPAGQKFLTELPSLTQESMRAGGDIMSRRLPEVMDRVEARANELAAEFAKDPVAPSKQ
jgi:hypothetical protein